MSDPGAVDLLADPMPGPELHRWLAEVRQREGLTTVRVLGEPALLVTRSEDLRCFLGDDERFPGATTYQQTVALQVGETFISMESPDHETYRQLATPAFRSRAVSRFVDDALVPLAHEVVDRFVGRGEADLVAELARVLPFWAIARKLGLPRGDEERMRELALAMFGDRFAVIDPDEAVREITRLVQPELDRRKLEPGDDVLSQLLAAERDGRRMSDDEIINHVRLLFAVGATTTSDSMSNLLWLLLSTPGLLELARDEPGSRPGIVSEVLRMEPAVVVLPRRAALGGELAGAELPEGALVMLALAAANREPERFEQPDRLDPWRTPGDLWSFGFGNKYCPGTHLARQQLGVALDVVLERLKGLRLVSSPGASGSVLRSTATVVAAWSN